LLDLRQAKEEWNTAMTNDRKNLIQRIELTINGRMVPGTIHSFSSRKAAKTQRIG
jgi:hypothetical protein